MKFCVFSDIHGNLPFFETFLRAVEEEKPDRLYFLGDCVSYYPDGIAVIRKLRELQAICVEGNHDSMLRGEFPIPENHEPVYRLRPVMESIPDDLLSYVKTWPEIRKETIDGKRLVFVHGSPLNHLKGYSYEDSDLALYDDPEADLVFVGHTHRPWIRQNPHTMMVNVGSVGLPRDPGNGCRPSWAVFDTQSGTVRLERIDADPELALDYGERIHESVRNCLIR